MLIRDGRLLVLKVSCWHLDMLLSGKLLVLPPQGELKTVRPFLVGDWVLAETG